jgi:hypothetical protein
MSAPDGSGDFAVCPNCSDAEAIIGDPPAEKTSTPIQKEQPASRSRFKDLIAEPQENDEVDRWPDEILEDLPEETRSLLAEGTKKGSESDTDDGMDDRMLHHLREKGYVISQDGDSLRLDSSLSRPEGGPSMMSPHDIVKLVAGMDGGIVPPEKRLQCPKCEAATPSGEKRCQWCGEPLSQDETPSD